MCWLRARVNININLVNESSVRATVEFHAEQERETTDTSISDVGNVQLEKEALVQLTLIKFENYFPSAFVQHNIQLYVPYRATIIELTIFLFLMPLLFIYLFFIQPWISLYLPVKLQNEIL